VYFSQSFTYSTIRVQYRVIYVEADCTDCPLAGDTPSPGGANLVVPQGINGIRLMEAAIARNSKYCFTVTFDNADLWYFIDSINGTPIDDANSCFWELSFRPYLAKQFIVSSVGISNYYPSPNTVVTWRYRKFSSPWLSKWSWSWSCIASSTQPVFQ